MIKTNILDLVYFRFPLAHCEPSHNIPLGNMLLAFSWPEEGRGPLVSPQVQPGA